MAISQATHTFSVGGRYVDRVYIASGANFPDALTGAAAAFPASTAAARQGAPVLLVRPGGALDQLFPLPADVLDGRTKDGFVYPVAIYDHDEGVAISGGFAYNGNIQALRGKVVFGDINRGRACRCCEASCAAVLPGNGNTPVSIS